MFDSSKVKRNMTSSIKNFVYELLHKLPDHLRFTILEVLLMFYIFYLTFLLFAKYCAQNYLEKQFFAYSLSQSSSNFTFLTFLEIQRLDQVFNTNVKQTSCGKVPNLKVFSKHYLACFMQIKKWQQKGFSVLICSNFFLINFFVLI